MSVRASIIVHGTGGSSEKSGGGLPSAVAHLPQSLLKNVRVKLLRPPCAMKRAMVVRDG